MKLDNTQKAAMHYGIAERGKMYCLEGNYKEALRHYREAIQMTVREGSPDVFFQHYTQCVMESLELSGAHDEVINYCDKALGFLENKEDSAGIVNKTRAVTMEKKAVQHLLKGEREEATPLLKQAQELVGRRTQPLTDDLLNWTQRGYSITPQQIRQAQKRHNYFVVRKETVNPSIAVDLPKAVSPF